MANSAFSQKTRLQASAFPHETVRGVNGRRRLHRALVWVPGYLSRYLLSECVTPKRNTGHQGSQASLGKLQLQLETP